MTAHAPVKPDAIEAFMPWATADERQLRRRILNCQQIASTRAPRAGSDRARLFYWTACDIAAATVFASSSGDHLQEVLDTLVRLFLVAGAVERWETTDG